MTSTPTRWTVVLCLASATAAEAQTSSIKKRAAGNGTASTAQPVQAASTASAQTTSSQVRSQAAALMGTPPVVGYAAVRQNSLIAVTMTPPKTFKVHDLITIIVREQHKFESDDAMESRNKFEAQSQLDAFIKFTAGGIGASDFRRGKPNIDYSLDLNRRDEGDKKREDTLTTRITAEIIDVKPNGNLVLSAEKMIEYDEETSVLTLTGQCRSTDVTPDNTVLSTQIANSEVRVKNSGAVNDATKTGWFTKLYSKVKPF